MFWFKAQLTSFTRYDLLLLMDQQQTITTSITHPNTVPLAGEIIRPENGWYKARFLRRFFALLVDSLFILIVMIPFMFIIGFDNEETLNLIVLVIYLIYYVFSTYKWGATFGKKLLKLKVVDVNYQSPSLLKVILRETVGRILSGLVFNLGYLWVIWDKNKQSWHDKIAGTYVVTEVPNNQKESVLAYILLGFLAMIPIVAILAVIVAIAINPLEMMRRGRDQARLSDITAVAKVIDEVAAENGSLCQNVKPCEGSSLEVNAKATDGTGWVKINLTKGTPKTLSALPVDPINKQNTHYRYCSDGTDWEINMVLEAIKSAEKLNTDNGDRDEIYEIGSKLTICP